MRGAVRAANAGVSYGRVYGVNKTTVYLPDDLKAALARIAEQTGRSEAELIREGVRMVVDGQLPPPPTIPIFVSPEPDFAERVDEHLGSFGAE